jgi:hypothetical protein
MGRGARGSEGAVTAAPRRGRWWQAMLAPHQARDNAHLLMSPDKAAIRLRRQGLWSPGSAGKLSQMPVWACTRPEATAPASAAWSRSVWSA